MLFKLNNYFIYALSFILFSSDLYSFTYESVLKQKLDISGVFNLSSGYLNNSQNRQSGIYYGVGINTQVLFYGVPFTVDYSIVKGSRGKVQLGHFSLEFLKADFINYLNQSEGRYFSNDSSKISQDIDSISHALNDPDYQERISECKRSLRQMTNDSLRGVIANDAVRKDSLTKTVDEYNSLRKRFYQIRESQNKLTDNINDHKSSDSLKKETNHINKNISNSRDTLNPSSRKNLNKVQKILSNFEEIKIGYHVIDQSYLSIYSYPLSGGTVKYKKNNLIFGGTVGVHQRFYSSSAFALLRNSEILNELQDKQTLYQGLIGFEDPSFSLLGSYSHFRSVTRSNENINEVGERSSIININSTKRLTEESVLKFEASKSLPSVQTDQQKFSDMAFSIGSENTFSEIDAHVGINYLMIGENFHSPGNSYLQNNFQSIKVKGDKQFFNGRLGVNSEASYSWCKEWVRDFLSVGFNLRVSPKLTLTTRSLINEYIIKPSDKKQIILSNQLTVNVLVSKSITSGVTGYYGRTVNTDNSISHDYQQSIFTSVRFSKSTIGCQLNRIEKRLISGTHHNLSASLSFSTIMFKQLTAGIIVSENIGSTKTLSSRINCSYPITKRLSFQVSYGSTNYYDHSFWMPLDISYQAQGNLSFKF